MKHLCCLAFALLCAVAAYSQAFSCPAGTEDMMNYFVMGYPNRLGNYMGPGNANPIYSTIVPDDGVTMAPSGYMVWTKSHSGYPWDVKSFDQNYVYDRTTELSWSDPTSFKRFNADLPMTQRCVPLGKAGATVKVPATNTKFSFYASCQSYKTQDLNYALNTTSKPLLVNGVGNLGSVLTRYFRYHYGCNSSYGGCTDMEVFSLGYLVGLYDWKHYVSQNGKWNLVQESQINQLDVGQTTPYLPCASSYQ